MGRIALRISLAALILGLSFPFAWAQGRPAQQKQEPAAQKPKDTRVAKPAKPIQPISSENAKGATAENDESQPAADSGQNQKPLSGAEEYTLSTMGQTHNYFYPLIQVAESADTNGYNQLGPTTFETVSTISGAFTLNHVWSRYTFSANYAGSGFIYNRAPSLSSSAHAFRLSQTIRGARSSFLLTDAVSYLPEASFGYARFGGIAGTETGGMGQVPSTGLNGIYVPNQSVLAGNSTRLSNSAVAEYDYSLSPLSSLTLTGSYGLLHFPDSGFYDSNSGIFGMGYNHSFTSRDTLAFTYLGSVTRYDLPAYNFSNHIVALVYGHRINQVLSLRLGGGPQVNLLGSVVNNDTRVSWYATASLAYQLQRTGLSLYYKHYTSAGAGVFLGATTDNLTFNIGRQLSRMWSGGVALGYSHNKNLQGTATAPSFNTWYTFVNLRRHLGPFMTLFLSYNLQQQYSNSPYCIGSGCGTLYSRNYFSIGFNWHPRSAERAGIE